MDFIATQASDLVQQVDEQSRLAVAIVVIVWISAIASSFIDNIPFTTAMVRRNKKKNIRALFINDVCFNFGRLLN